MCFVKHVFSRFLKSKENSYILKCVKNIIFGIKIHFHLKTYHWFLLLSFLVPPKSPGPASKLVGLLNFLSWTLDTLSVSESGSPIWVDSTGRQETLLKDKGLQVPQGLTTTFKVFLTPSLMKCL